MTLNGGQSKCTFIQRGRKLAKKLIKTNRRRKINAHTNVRSKKVNNKRRLNQEIIDCIP